MPIFISCEYDFGDSWIHVLELTARTQRPFGLSLHHREQRKTCSGGLVKSQILRVLACHGIEHE